MTPVHPTNQAQAETQAGTVSRLKTVVELLAERPTDELLRMQQVNQRSLHHARTEVARLELEEQQIAEALGQRA